MNGAFGRRIGRALLRLRSALRLRHVGLGFFLGLLFFLIDRAGDVGCIGVAAAREVEGLLRPGRFACPGAIIEHVSAVEHQACNLHHRKAKARNQNNGKDANVTKRFHAARPLDLLRSENAWAAADTALALGIGAGVGEGANEAESEGVGTEATAGAAAGSGMGAEGRAAIAIFDMRRTTPSHSPSCFLSCADISVAASS